MSDYDDSVIDRGDTADNGVVARRGLHAKVLDQLGMAVCGQELTSGTVMTIEDIEHQYEASRSVVRETIRVLESMGLVSSKRRVGVLVLPPSEWNLYDPQVIRWRLASRGRITQVRSLMELRMAIEPEAARLAAVRAPLTNASDLMGLAGQLWAAGQAGNGELFLSLDIHFHRLVLASSGNEMFAKLENVVTEVMTGTTHYGLMPDHPHEETLQLHMDLAAAIQRGAADVAHASMLAIMQRALKEMSTSWESSFKNREFIRGSLQSPAAR
jgi:DNA-binding FadR family transcriptional regulator